MSSPEEIRKKTEALEAEEKTKNSHNARRRIAAKRSREQQEEDPKRKLDQAGIAFVKKRQLRKELIFEAFQTCRDALDENEPLEVEKLPKKLAELESRVERARRHRAVCDFLQGRHLTEEELDELTEQDDQPQPIHQPLVEAMEALDESGQPSPELLAALDDLADALENGALPMWFASTEGGLLLDDLYTPEDPDDLDVKIDAVRSLIELYEEADKLEIDLPCSKKVLGARVRRYLTPTRKDSKNFG